MKVNRTKRIGKSDNKLEGLNGVSGRPEVLLLCVWIYRGQRLWSLPFAPYVKQRNKKPKIKQTDEKFNFDGCTCNIQGILTTSLKYKNTIIIGAMKNDLRTI